MFYIIGQLVIMFLALLGLMWCIEWVICRMCSPKAKDFITIVAPSSKEDLEQALRWARQSARWDIWFRPYEVLCVLPKQDAEGYGEIMAAIKRYSDNISVEAMASGEVCKMARIVLY